MNQRWLAAALAVILALVAVTAVVQMGNGRSRTIPDELLGTWTTSAPDYGGRAVEMTPTTLRLHTGAPSDHAFPVLRVVCSVPQFVRQFGLARDTGSTPGPAILLG